jgi:hypothetical protein
MDSAEPPCDITNHVLNMAKTWQRTDDKGIIMYHAETNDIMFALSTDQDNRFRGLVVQKNNRACNVLVWSSDKSGPKTVNIYRYRFVNDQATDHTKKIEVNGNSESVCGLISKQLDWFNSTKDVMDGIDKL